MLTNLGIARHGFLKGQSSEAGDSNELDEDFTSDSDDELAVRSGGPS